jgi:lysophospholipase L1-like esterase
MNFKILNKQVGQSRRIVLKSLLAAVFAGGALIACGGGNDAPPSTAAWYASWYAAPQLYQEPFGGVTPPAKTFKDQTLRQVMYVSAGGNKLRVRVSNRLGTAPLTIDGMRVAESAGGAAIRVATDTPVLFGAQNSVTVAPGAEVLSDPVALAVSTHSSVAVSLYVKNATPVATVHSLGKQNNYVAAGNVVSAPTLTVTESNLFYAWTTGLEVERTDKPKVIVTFGDSITDGYGSTDDTNNRYPNFLSRRLAADASIGPVSVVNAGISGNRWKNDVIGPKGEDRFERDVLGQPGITHVVILLGINDIGFSGTGSFMAGQAVTAEQIQQAIQAAVNKAQAKGVKALVGTLTPFKGTIFPGYYSDEGEAKRQAVNSFIRSNSTIDGVIDFDLAVRDPADPASILPAYDVGDHLHPNNAGYAAMANAIDLAKFK